MITIRQYTAEDAKQALDIFRLSIKDIDESEYSFEQKQAWLGAIDNDFDKNIENQRQQANWQQRLDKTKPLIATDNKNTMIGFIEFLIDQDQCNQFKCGEAYIDCLYVHPKYQRRGVAQILYDEMWLSLLKNNIEIVWVYASKLAYSFFLKQGFKIVEQQAVKRHNVSLERYLMCKHI